MVANGWRGGEPVPCKEKMPVFSAVSTTFSRTFFFFFKCPAQDTHLHYLPSTLYSFEIADLGLKHMEKTRAHGPTGTTDFYFRLSFLFLRSISEGWNILFHLFALRFV